MRSNRSGFTLLETVTALALASAGLAAVYQVYASAARAERVASEAMMASQLAENLLATTLGETVGANDSFSWEINISPVPDHERLIRQQIVLISLSGREYVFEIERVQPDEAGE